MAANSPPKIQRRVDISSCMLSFAPRAPLLGKPAAREGRPEVHRDTEYDDRRKGQQEKVHGRLRA